MAVKRKKQAVRLHPPRASEPEGREKGGISMKIIKIADYDNEKERLTYDEALKAVEKQGCRLLTTNEYLSMDKKTFKEYYSAVPTWLAKTSSGLLARGDDFLYVGRVVDAVNRPSGRFGVLGTPVDKAQKQEDRKRTFEDFLDAMDKLYGSKTFGQETEATSN